MSNTAPAQGDGDKYLDDLQYHATRLVELLARREPGLFSWWGMVHATVVDIEEHWNQTHSTKRTT